MQPAEVRHVEVLPAGPGAHQRDKWYMSESANFTGIGCVVLRGIPAQGYDGVKLGRGSGRSTGMHQTRKFGVQGP